MVKDEAAVELEGVGALAGIMLAGAGLEERGVVVLTPEGIALHIPVETDVGSAAALGALASPVGETGKVSGIFIPGADTGSGIDAGLGVPDGCA